MGIAVIVVLSLVFFFGMKQPVTKVITALAAHLIAIPLAGVSYQVLASVLSFLPGDNWDKLVGFFAAKYLIIAVLYFGALHLLKQFGVEVPLKGTAGRLFGGAADCLNSAMGVVTLYLAVQAFPAWGWLERVMGGSDMLKWLSGSLGFIKAMLPFA